MGVFWLICFVLRYEELSVCTVISLSFGFFSFFRFSLFAG